jgi:hypothetical protein
MQNAEVAVSCEVNGLKLNYPGFLSIKWRRYPRTWPLRTASPTSTGLVVALDMSPLGRPKPILTTAYEIPSGTRNMLAAAVRDLTIAQGARLTPPLGSQL